MCPEKRWQPRTFFALRAFATLSGARWPLALPARAASWVVDTGLLSAGALLWATLQVNPLVEAWLGAKLVLLLVYVGLGTIALRRARSPASAGYRFLRSIRSEKCNSDH